VSETEGPDSNLDEAETRRRASSGKTKNRLRRSLIAIGLGVVGIVVLQWLAPRFDHQIANIVSISLGITIACYVVLQTQLAALAKGHHWGVPLAMVALVAGFFVLFEPDGFSGEMVPQFRFRFGGKHELKTVSDQQADPTATEHSSALADSPGFLGKDRNAVVAERMFAVPTSPEDVEVLWDQGIGQGWASFAVAGDRAVTLEQRDQLECVTCYRLADGELLWMHSHQAYHYHPLGGAGPRSTPQIHDGQVFAMGATGHLCCLQLETGDPVWEVDLPKLTDWSEENLNASVAWGYAGSPLIVDDLCIVPFGSEVDPNDPKAGQRSLIALKLSSGEVSWKSGYDQISYASPVLMTMAGERQIVSVNEKTISGHRVAGGQLLWTFDWPGSSNSNASCATVVPAGENRFLIGKGYGGGSALVEVSKSPDGGFQANPIWESNRVIKTKFTHPCVDGDVAYALSDGSLQAVNLSDGDRLWMQPRSARFGQGQILLADDVIIAQAEAGDVVFVSANPDEYQELRRLPALSSKTWNIPTLAGRHLLVRNDRQAICYLLPAKQ
jgi:outer membrane protein assembly factor BamB